MSAATSTLTRPLDQPRDAVGRFATTENSSPEVALFPADFTDEDFDIAYITPTPEDIDEYFAQPEPVAQGGGWDESAEPPF